MVRTFTRVLSLLAVGWTLTPIQLSAQGETDYLPGKVYIIRITPFLSDRDSLERFFETVVRTELKSANGMLHHVQDNLYTMSSAANNRWFIGYFHADRQSKDELMQDLDLLIWLLHGHDVQIMPIESANSPATTLVTPSADR